MSISFSKNPFFGLPPLVRQNSGDLEERHEISRLMEWGGEETVHVLPLTKHGLNVNRAAREAGILRTFSQQELADKIIDVVDGKLTWGLSREVLDTGPIEMMFVMDKDKRIYSEYPGPGCFHSSLVEDDWPIAAGMLRCINGDLTKINEESGHFAPHERVHLVIEELKRRGVALPPFVSIEASRHSQELVERTNIPSPEKQKKRLQGILSSKPSIDGRTPTPSPFYSAGSSSPTPSSSSLTSRQSPHVARMLMRSPANFAPSSIQNFTTFR